MEKVREVVSGTLSLRKAAKIRVRQPLSKLTVVAEGTWTPSRRTTIC